MRHLGPTALVALLVVGASACADAPGTRTPSDPPPSPCSPTGDLDASTPLPGHLDAEHYDSSLFDASAGVVNRWQPLPPGTRLFYRGSSLDEGERLNHTVDVIVTDLTKVIDGVTNVVVWERDYTEGELVEAELALFATDESGNVWHMGEYPEEYEEGEFVKAPAWVHGLAGACAGITIPGKPRLGTPDYAQGYAPPPISWVDRGLVRKTGTEICVPAGCYQDVVVIQEFETGVADAFQDKHYAPGVGVVYVGWRGSKDESKEVLELESVTRLTASQLAEARSGALALEKSARRRSADLWAKTGPPGRADLVGSG